MSNPGPDGTPEGQQPGQPGQPGGYGQPGPYGQQPGRPGPYQPFDQQPGRPAGGWVPPQGGATPVGRPDDKGGAARKVLLAVAGVLVALVVVGLLVSMLGAAEPEVGDCVRSPAGEEVEIVDCDSADAEARIVGIDQQALDFDEFMAQEVCLDFPNALNAVWVGDDRGEPGTIYCAEPV